MGKTLMNVDHDYHIHSYLSSCSRDPEQTGERILQYAEDNGFSEICLTNHYWDEKVSGPSKWYEPQNTTHLKQALPLPQSDNVRFYFGCETEMRKDNTIGISPDSIELFDFIIVPTTHFHMEGFTIDEGASFEHRAEAWVNRFWALLNSDLPLEKVGIAHLTCQLIAGGSRIGHHDILRLISDDVMRELFAEAAKKRMGIELNFRIERYSDTALEEELRPYRIARDCGCKFYFGSDSHQVKEFAGVKERFAKIVKALSIPEEQRFRLTK